MKRRRWYRMLASLVALAASPTPAPGDVPDPSNSYFVPQVGLDYANPIEGDSAITYFRMCPNNDSVSLPLAARIKIVAKESNGAPIPGISPADICVLFNGGTQAQGFFGIGADSVIANFQWNQAANCPDVRCIPADAPTDANGVAYITFKGPGGIRDPNRKWGHYDSELPVLVLGYKIPGRVTSSSPTGSYVLQIKNLDTAGGLLALQGDGERVTFVDANVFTPHFGHTVAQDPNAFWVDFDSDGLVGLADRNMLIWHDLHRCNFPNNP